MNNPRSLPVDFACRGRRAAAIGLFAAAAALSVAACGGSNGGGKSTGSAPAASSSAVTVKASKLPGYNSVLTTASGKAVYLLTADPAGSSKCTGSCASQWPPLLATGTPSAGSGVKQSLLSTFKRSDGKVQVMYNKHPLYTHAGAGVTSGAGMAADGGVWYLVSPSGSAVKSTSSGGY